MKKSFLQSFQVPFSYPVYFDSDIFNPDNDLLATAARDISHDLPARVYIVIDQGVMEAHPTLEDQIRTYFQQHEHILKCVDYPLIVTGGEGVKNEPEWVHHILADVERLAIDRHAYIMAIGGGAVLDMVGYAASIAHRGVRHIRIPTTVLSQNDSGVGVKNGINAFGKKNFIGNFCPPHLVINDSAFLPTLDDRDWRSGISEAVKVALIKDREFFEYLEGIAPALSMRELPEMEQLIYRCALHHLDHIRGGDPFEMGSSRPLDFGHWAAHKLEQLTGYQLRHGEAVAVGISLDVCYSWLDGRITEEDCLRVLALFRTVGLPVFDAALETLTEDGKMAVIQGLEEFREHLGGNLTIMLLDDIGHGTNVHEMDPSKITRAIAYLKKHSLTPTH